MTPTDDMRTHEHHWSDWIPGAVAQHRYCLCGEAQMRPLGGDHA